MRARVVVLGVMALLGVVACSDDDGGSSATEAPTTSAEETTTSTTATEPVEADAALVAEIEAALDAAPDGCDPLDDRHCLLPFPSDALTVQDPDSDTGRRLAIPERGTPQNVEGTHVDTAEWNRNDGFSPNSTILTYLGPVHWENSDLPSWTDLETSLAEDSPTVVLDLTTGERIPHWAEPDLRASAIDDRALVIHPAVPLPEGHRIAVGLQHLQAGKGVPISPDPVFLVYRDRLVTDIDVIEQRRPAMEEVLAGLQEAGIRRSDLIRAWDFTVASERNLSERMLHIRDEALAAIEEAPTTYEITEVLQSPDPLTAIEVIGTYEIPSFLAGDGAPGSRFAYDAGDDDPDRLPVRNGSIRAPFRCQVAPSTLAGTAGPARLALYGHGLLGSEDEIHASNVRAMGDEHNVVFCATRWAGFSEDDIGNAAATLTDVSNFPTMVDRMQQGLLNQIVLGRLMLRPDGLLADPAFGGIEVDRSRLVFDGNSQGGIMGGALTAVSPDIERAVLGVMGMNYSLLLYRSVDFDSYEEIMRPAYPNDLDRALLISMIQVLWDRGENGGYVQHLAHDTYEGSAPSEVLLHVALGDHQVTELSALIAARAVGARAVAPLVAPGRSAGDEHLDFGLEPVESFPYDGSAVVFWDSGAEPIPVAQEPPRVGFDPHEDPRADPDVRRQKAAFLFDDELIDVCGGEPCEADRSE